MGPGFRYAIYWSPDSKKVGFIDQTMAMHVVDVKTGNDVIFDKEDNLFEDGLAAFTLSWSSDSRYLTYAKSQRNNNSAVFIYDTKLKTNHQLTSGFYSDMMPYLTLKESICISQVIVHFILIIAILIILGRMRMPHN